jgi:hypothetical protein
MFNASSQLGLAEILGKHIAEQHTLFDGVVDGDVGMGIRVEPMFGHAAFRAFAIVLFQQGHCVGFDIEGGEAEGAFAGEAVYAADPKLNIEFGPGIGPSASTSVLT